MARPNQTPALSPARFKANSLFDALTARANQILVSSPACIKTGSLLDALDDGN